jgi:hypothetical protein
MRRGRGEEMGQARGDLQAPSHPEAPRQRRSGMPVLHCHCPEAPPGVASSCQPHSGVPSHRRAGLSSRATIVWCNLTP